MRKKMERKSDGEKATVKLKWGGVGVRDSVGIQIALLLDIWVRSSVL